MSEVSVVVSEDTPAEAAMKQQFLPKAAPVVHVAAMAKAKAGAAAGAGEATFRGTKRGAGERGAVCAAA